jgi:hypothetical protein
VKSILTRTVFLAAVTLTLSLPCVSQTPAQLQARRLILKDGSYQSVTKYEVKGDRVRYFSAERGEWEEVPKSLIDWDATGKFEQGREPGKLAPEAAELDKQLEAERKAELARSPQVAPGLRLPEEGGVFLLETYDNQPQLVEIQQSGTDLNQDLKANILRATINPLAGAKQTLELPGPHSKVQSHTTVPSLYVNLDVGGPAAIADPDQGPPPQLAERFKIIRIQTKGGKRVAGALKVAITGKMKTDERFAASTATVMTGGWVQVTPSEPLPAGEYAVAEMLGKEGMNLYVWDFGVNPSAPANTGTWKPELEAKPRIDQPQELQKREKQ